MKDIKLLLTTMILLAALSLTAQVPQQMNYQAVVRTSAGATVPDQTQVRLQFIIHDGSATGSTVYTETSAVLTANQFGLVTTAIGANATLGGINWGTSTKWLQVKVDVGNTGTFTDMGTTQINSVAYALYAANGGGSTGGWTLTGNGGTVDTVNFIGTTDTHPLNFRINNVNAGRMDFTYNNFYGIRSGSNNRGFRNTGIGTDALHNNAAANDNTALGALTLYANQTGNRNVAIGSSALQNCTGSDNVAVGDSALLSMTSGDQNTAIGTRTLQKLNGGGFNTAIGYTSQSANVIGNYNTSLGAYSLVANLGDYNTAIGEAALMTNSSGHSNCAVGTQALTLNYSGNYNAAFGYRALYSDLSGSSNTASGAEALTANTGNFNTATGRASLQANASGSSNAAYGAYSLTANVDGIENTSVGTSSLFSNVTGSQNTAVGRQALYTSTGYFNTAIGFQALVQTTGNNNIGIGANTIVPIAANDNQVRIGDANITYAGVQVAWSVTSDRRWKSDIRQSPLGLDFIRQLRPVAYYRTNDKMQKTEYGFIAQEVEQTLRAHGDNNSGFITIADDGMYSLRYNDFIAPMVRAIQEQQELISTLKQQADQQRKVNEELLSRISKLESR